MKAVVILQEHPGRFGNKLLHYNNAAQLAKYYDCDVMTVCIEDYSIFDFKFINNKANEIKNSNSISLNAKKLMKRGYDSIKDYDYLILKPSLGEMFFEFDYDTKEIFQLTENMQNFFKEFTSDYKLPGNVKHIRVGIHFRGTDFHTWNPKAVLDFEYYKRSIDRCIEELQNQNTLVSFKLFTDDKNLESFKRVKDYIFEINATPFKDILGWNTENGGGYFHDFIQLANCDVIISSPSTFSICAGCMFKDKKIIHSMDWIKYRIEANDKFWIDLYKGGNSNYKLWLTKEQERERKLSKLL